MIFRVGCWEFDFYETFESKICQFWRKLLEILKFSISSWSMVTFQIFFAKVDTWSRKSRLFPSFEKLFEISKILILSWSIVVFFKFSSQKVDFCWRRRLLGIRLFLKILKNSNRTYANFGKKIYEIPKFLILWIRLFQKFSNRRNPRQPIIFDVQ